MSKNEDKKKSFVMYDSFLEAMKHLNDAEFRECVMKIRDYALEGIDKESASPMVNIILAMARPNLDAARRRYETSVENGKKGAEYGKLGGAPKGNQNARKKQPLNQPQKQPLNVDVEENINENEEVDINEDTPVEDIIHSSFSNSSNRVLSKEIENDSERLEEREEKRNLPIAGKKEENPQYSKTNSNNTVPVSPGYGRGTANSTARPRRRTVKGGEYDQSEYYSLCLNNYVLDLADMRLGILPNEDGLFWQAVDLYKVLYGKSNDEAIKTISSTVNEIVQQKK